MITLLTLITITSSATYPIILMNSLRNSRKSDKILEQALKQAKLLQNVRGKMIRLAFHRSAKK